MNVAKNIQENGEPNGPDKNIINLTKKLLKYMAKPQLRLYFTRAEINRCDTVPYSRMNRNNTSDDVC